MGSGVGVAAGVGTRVGVAVGESELQATRTLATSRGIETSASTVCIGNPLAASGLRSFATTTLPSLNRSRGRRMRRIPMPLVQLWHAESLSHPDSIGSSEISQTACLNRCTVQLKSPNTAIQMHGGLSLVKSTRCRTCAGIKRWSPVFSRNFSPFSYSSTATP